MYHHRGWKDVTKFTDGGDLAHRPSVQFGTMICVTGPCDGGHYAICYNRSSKVEGRP